MATLKAMPPPVSSAEELMAMAHAMEKGAARRYRNLAGRMKLRGDSRLEALFNFLADIEEKHAVQIDDRSRDLLGEVAAPMPIGWEVPEIFDEEEGSSRLLTPYRALANAVRNEDKAFAFYSYVAAGALDDGTRQLAEELAKDELMHAHLLRRERRRAFRAERTDRLDHLGVPENLEGLWAMAAEAEGRAARYHHALAVLLERTDKGLAALFTRAAEDEETCAREAEGRLGGGQLASLPSPEPTMEGGLRLLEEIFERYADIVESTKDEAIMQQTQVLAERAVRRLSLVRGSMADDQNVESGKNSGLTGNRKP